MSSRVSPTNSMALSGTGQGTLINVSPTESSSSPVTSITPSTTTTTVTVLGPDFQSAAISPRSNQNSTRQPIIVPRRGDHVVNVATLWPERVGQTSARDRKGKQQVTPEMTGAVVSPFAPENLRTGAEKIVAEHTGDMGNGKLVAQDGNTHRDSRHKRPVTLLPPCCEGAMGLKIPELIKGHIANVTLPSRLALLGRQSYEIIAALRPINMGNSVVGFAPVLGRRHFKSDLYVLPSIFSRGGARIYIFLRVLLLIVFLVFFIQFTQVYDLNIGRAWFFGAALAIFIMYQLTLIRRAPDGVMAFCRSMGAPEIEEYMFSYSWKVEPDAIRTLAKAVWNNNVGVWIDVVKLCPGDEIRPMVRTMVNRVHRCVVFLSPAYIGSPNCCVEFHEAVQWPEKLLICMLQPVPELDEFLEQLKQKGAVVVVGIRELIERLDQEICDVNNSSAWRWWRKQKISGGGVPSHVVPTYWHTIPKFSLTGKLRVAPRSLTAGPVYLAGDCSDAGQRFYPPLLFFLSIIAVAANFTDLYLTFHNNDCTDTGCASTKCHNTVDYCWLTVIAACTLAPFTVIASLFETRTDVHPVMRPLLASKSMNGGVKITIIGHDTDPIVVNLNKFLTNVGHNAADKNPTIVGPSNTDSHSFNPGRALTQEADAPKQQRNYDGGLAESFSHSITVYVMRDFVQRDALFGKDDFPFDPRTSLFVWSDPVGDPFTKDEIGERLMRFLVLVAAWDKNLLAENLFSAIGVRVVDMLHSADYDTGTVDGAVTDTEDDVLAVADV